MDRDNQGSDAEYYRSKAESLERQNEERDDVEKIIIALIAAVLLAAWLGWNSLAVWPFFFTGYWLLKRK